MPQASITVNGTPGSDDNLPIAQLVQLDNQNIGGEVSYAWTILDQPPGAADSLSSSSIQNPTFTPNKEGTYLIRLVVNASLPTEQTDQIIVAVRQVKTLQRIPAAGETTEADAADGWAVANNAYLRTMDAFLSDPGIIVGVNASGGVLSRGQVVRATAASVIKSGLPGQETVPGFSVAHANTLGEIDELLAVIEGGIDGSVNVANGALMKVRYIGRLASITPGGTAAVGDTVYLNDAGGLSLTQGTIRRRVGSAMSAGTTFDVWFNGVGGADIDLTPIDRAYVVWGNPGTLPNALRVDGTNATGVAGTPYRIRPGDAATVAFQVQGAAAQTANLQEWLNSAGTVLAKVDNNGVIRPQQGIQMDGGSLTFPAQDRTITWPAYTLTEHSGSSQWRVTYPGNGNYMGWSPPFASMSALELGTALPTSTVLTNSDTLGFVMLVSGARPLVFNTNGTNRWQVAATGELQAQGGNRAINNVLDPVNAQDAATKNYTDTRAGSLRNAVINGAFDFWQRGAPLVATHTSSAGTADRAFGPDRWFGYIRDDNFNNSGTTLTMSQQAFGSQSKYAMRAAIQAGGAGTAGEWYVVQEIDREYVRRLRGKKVTLRLKGKLNGMVGNEPGIVIMYGSDATPDKTFYATSTSSGYGAATAAVSTTPTWTGTMDTFTVTTGAVIPTTATEMAIVFGGAYDDTFNGDYLEITEVSLVEGDLAPLDYTWAGGTWEGELDLCQHYFQKSYQLWETPGSTTDADDSWYTAFVNQGSIANGALLTLGAHPRFSRAMRAGGPNSALRPVVTLYNASTGTSGQWQFAGGTLAIAAYASGTAGRTSGFGIINNSGGAYNPGANVGPVYGHWTADAEI